MRLEGGGGELLQQPADGIAVGAHAALFNHHIALLVELAHDRMQEALRFEVGPKFQPVFRKRVVIFGLVFAGRSVQAFGAVAFENLRETRWA